MAKEPHAALEPQVADPWSRILPEHHHLVHQNRNHIVLTYKNANA